MTEFSKRIKISEKMADIIMAAPDYLYTWMEGSAQCGKSVTAAISLALLIENAPIEDNLFLALGYTVTSAKNNIFECGGFGVRHYFGSRCKPCKYMGIADALKIQTKTGIKHLVAFGTSTKTSNNAWHGWRVAGFLFDEIDRACEESIDEMKQRITAVANPHIIVTQNPNFPKHPIYKFLDELLERGLVNYSHWILDDNIGLTPAKIQEVKDRYDPTGIYYRRYILGERVNPEGQIFQLNDYNLMESYDPKDYSFYITVADPGKSKSATSFIMAAYNYKEKSIDILEEYWYKNPNNTIAIKHSRDTVKDFLDFNKRCAEIMNRWPQVCILDSFPSDDFFDYAFTDSRAAGLPLDIKMPIDSEGKGGKDEDEVRISRTTTLLFTGKLRFMNHCTHCIDDLSTLEYDSKALEKGVIKISEVFDGSGHGDAADSVFYATTYLKNFVL